MGPGLAEDLPLAVEPLRQDDDRGQGALAEDLADRVDFAGRRVGTEVKDDRPWSLVSGARAKRLDDGPSHQGLKAPESERHLEDPQPSLVRRDDEHAIGSQRARWYTSPSLDEAVETLLRNVAEHGASDLIFVAGRAATVRVDGRLLPLPTAVLTPDAATNLARSFAGARWDELVAKRELEFSMTDPDRARVRVNLFYQRGTPAGVLRFVPYRIPTLQELGAPAICAELADQPHGLVLVTGPSGSGKSTTLAAMIDKINRERAACIITVEDPIEYVHSHQKSVVMQREIGSDARGFADALRSALRENPDVVLVGEMRDLETMSAALTMAETGHLVFATLHTNDASQSIDRLVDVFPATQQNQIRVQLSQMLLAVIHQQLLPRANGPGRVAAFEIMIATPAVRNLIKEGRTNQLRNVIQTGTAQGMQTLEADLRRLVREGLVARDAAALLTLRPGEVAPEPVSAAAGGRAT